MRDKNPVYDIVNGVFWFYNDRLLKHSALVCGAYKACIAGQPAGLDLRLMRYECRTALCKFLLGNLCVDSVVRDIDLDDVALFQQSDFAALCSFRTNMSDEAPRDAPEKRPSVISATSLSSFMPASAEVGFSISRMPGPPFGPS